MLGVLNLLIHFDLKLQYMECVSRFSIDETEEVVAISSPSNAKTITDANYADDIAILANTPNQAETLQHSFEQTAAGISLHVNAHKTE